MNGLPRKTQPSRFRTRLSPPLVVTALVAVFILGYVSYQTKDLLGGPELFLEPGGAGTRQALLSIRGRASRIAHLFLNDNRIFTDEEGRFQEQLLLAPGYNIITVRASDKFNRQTSRVMEIVYTP